MKKKYLFLICAIICFSLGTWQYFRLGEKESLLTNINSNLKLDPVDINLIELNKSNLFRKVFLKGTYIFEKEIYLYKVLNNKEGYEILTPFKTSNKTYLINRGWINKNEFESGNFFQNPKLHLITGSLLSSNKKLLFIPEKSSDKIWINLNIDSIAKDLGLQLEQFYILLTDQNYPLIPKYELNIQNHHLQYMITWYLLSLAAIILIYYNNKYEKK